MNYKVIVFNNAEEIEKALEDAYDEGYNTGFDDCFEEAEDDAFKEIEAVKEELRKKHEAELDTVGHEAYEEGKKVGNEEGYPKGCETAKQLYGGLTTIPCVANECVLGSECKCTDAVSHINI